MNEPMPTIPIQLIEAPATGPDPIAGALLGIIAGAVLGGLAQWLIAHLQRSHARERELAEHRRQVYFNALDAGQAMRKAVQDLIEATNGLTIALARVPPAPQAEIDEYDAQQAGALERVWGASAELAVAGLKVRAVGGKQVANAVDAVENLAVTYTDRIDAELALGTVKMSTLHGFRRDVAGRSRDVAAAARTDLQVDKFHRER